MQHAHSHPPPISRCPRGMLADLLWRGPGGHDGQEDWQPSRSIALRLVLPFLFRQSSWGTHKWHGGDPRASPGRSPSRVAFLGKRTEADFQEWRHQRDWAERKYALWAKGVRMPAQRPNSLLTCPCGQLIDSHRLNCSSRATASPAEASRPRSTAS